MNPVRALLISCVLCTLQTTALSQERDPLPLQDRVAEAELIVLGTLHPKVVSKPQSIGDLDVERVLLGTARTNTVLTVRYASDERFFPGIFSTTHHISPTNRYICFLVKADVARGSTNSPVFRPVGTGRGYAADGFELATEKVLQETLELIADRNKKK
jgi:hypothetical protein